MASEDDQLHVMFLPFMAPGHMTPMVEIATLLASHGIKSTVITTTQNAVLYKPNDSGAGVRFLTLPFPSKEVGLPDGCENLTSVSTPETNMKLLRALDFLKPKIEEALQTNRPDCIVSDYLFPWTVDVAVELGIPRIAFNGSGLFNISVSDSLNRYKPHENVASETEVFTVPGLPDEVEFTRSQLPDIAKTKTEMSPLFETLKDAEKRSFGVLVNSFSELEPGYADHFKTNVGTKAWLLGPVSLFNKSQKIGTECSVTKHSCVSWLDNKKPGSVLYICFGSLTKVSDYQMKEIAAALEESQHFFIWVMRERSKSETETSSYDELEEHVMKNGKGLIIRGWAPQAMLLGHQAIGGFLTHCGWNSILEAVSAGVPMVTWPIFADQFYNEKLVTQVLKLGVSVGNEVWRLWPTDESPVVEMEKIKRAICRVMSDSEEGLELRRRAKRFGDLAMQAVKENGASYDEMKELIKDIRLYKQHKKEHKKVELK